MSMATIKDVAKEAGVAVGTVSKVINNIAVKPETKVSGKCYKKIEI